ncbi:response regulator transcription factor [Enterococcus sp. BWR-S5]|uniref:response regulator transcription factor n=1 Tax=Enterococcus sp. BWR-S5 TaxID=2787714 RepID=UPI0019236901|nr:response regulator transcription factor [Enterococcus sp. BWR-S5]MBL1225021.1 response regulator transcription factor [Enterococcus sp. BWR-S5]
MNILIIEDEKNVRNELKLLLKNAFYEVLMIEHFDGVVEQILAHSPDLVLLDLNLPNQNGQEICRTLRQASTVPVIFLTSDNHVMTELDCILMGGDDFITKPYTPSLLLARIQAVLKRTVHQSNEQFVMTHRGVTLNISTYKVSFKSEEIELTKTEFKLLHYLFQRKEEVVPRMDIIVYLWDNDVFIDDNALSVNMTRLRNKLENLGISGFIQTKRGVGYQI